MVTTLSEVASENEVQGLHLWRASCYFAVRSLPEFLTSFQSSCHQASKSANNARKKLLSLCNPSFLAVDSVDTFSQDKVIFLLMKPHSAMNSANALSIIIPVYNSEQSLPPLVEQLEPVLQGMGLGDYELIFVNDASKDGSWQVVEKLAAAKPWIRGINLMRNYGQHNALLCGIRLAKHPIIVTMDDDLQHPPGEMPKLLAALTDNVDVVYGTPEKEQHGFFRDMASVVTKMALQSAMGASIARKVSAFRAFRTQLRDAFATYSSPYVSIDVLLTWATTKFSSLPVRHDERTMGKSNYTLRKLIRHAINMITGFSVVPLRLATFIGFGFALLGMFLLLYVLGRYFLHGVTVQGFTFLASVVSLFSGVQLFALGIMGEYLARMHFRMMDRPTYTVRKDIGISKESVS